MKNATRVLAALMILFSSVSYGQTRKNEILLSSTEGTFFLSDNVRIVVTGGYGYFLQPQIELLGMVGFSHTSAGMDVTTFEILGGGRYHLSSDVWQSFFIEGLAGLAALDVKDFGDDTQFILEAGVGRRFQLFQNASLAYVPQASLRIMGGDFGVVLTPLSFSFLF